MKKEKKQSKDLFKDYLKNKCQKYVYKILVQDSSTGYQRQEQGTVVNMNKNQ